MTGCHPVDRMTVVKHIWQNVTRGFPFSATSSKLTAAAVESADGRSLVPIVSIDRGSLTAALQRAVAVSRLRLRSCTIQTAGGAFWLHSITSSPGMWEETDRAEMPCSI